MRATDFTSQGLIFIILKRRNPFVTVLVQLNREIDELLQHLFPFNNFNLYHICGLAATNIAIF